MAGSASTITYDDGQMTTGDRGSVKRVVIAWTSDDTSGAVTATTRKISGRLLKVTTDPGTPAPDANYDIAITDSNSIDILSNLGGTNGTAPTLANRHTTTTEVVRLVAEDNTANAIQIPDSSPYVCGTLAVAITNAGNSKQGTVIIYWTPG